MKDELLPLIDEILSRDAVQRRGWLRWDAVRDTVASHRAGKEDHTDHLMSLLNLEIWARLFLDKRSPKDVADELAFAVV